MQKIWFYAIRKRWIKSMGCSIFFPSSRFCVCCFDISVHYLVEKNSFLNENLKRKKKLANIWFFEDNESLKPSFNGEPFSVNCFIHWRRYYIHHHHSQFMQNDSQIIHFTWNTIHNSFSISFIFRTCMHKVRFSFDIYSSVWECSFSICQTNIK